MRKSQNLFQGLPIEGEEEIKKPDLRKEPKVVRKEPEPRPAPAPRTALPALPKQKKEQEAKQEDTHQKHQRKPAGRGREYDRRSGTGRVDGRKKEEAGHSWGKQVDVPQGISAKKAAEVAEQVEENPQQEPSVPEPERIETVSFEEFMRERRNKQLTVKSTPSRRPNEGMDFSPVIEKETNDSEVSLYGLGKVEVHQKPQRERKQRTEIILDAQFSSTLRPRGSDHRPPRGRPRQSRDFQE